MGRKHHLIIPIFIPFGGCPNRCVFCDQNGITGDAGLPSVDEVAATISGYLSTWKGSGPKEAAFYGGSFTGLPEDIQKRYLETARGFVSRGLIDSIRLSTRPDYISRPVLDMLRSYGVKTVELGAQSMSEEVLRLSGRGHGPEDTIKAAGLLKEHGFCLGLQFMPGLPGDSYESIISTTRQVIELRPDFVRVYPALVLRGTPLHKMYSAGHYRPWPLDEMVEVCRGAAALLKEAGIPIIRMGLHPSKELEDSLISGPYHPSFRQLVSGGLANSKLRAIN